MELLHQTHKEVPIGWLAALNTLFARPARKPRLLLSGPRYGADCRPRGGVA
jgi:hypothetical protein